MELRVLNYFLAVAREENITKAAEMLHVTQPTLSKQLMDLEDEIGKKLFIRGNRKITLTEEGVLLRKRAEEIVDLVSKTEKELEQSDDTISGDIFIGAGETNGFRWLLNVANKIKKEHPDIHYHISSGDVIDVLYNLDKGIIDFALVFGSVDTNKYDCVLLPPKDTWGVLMRKDSELADKAFISPEDLYDKPLIVSRQAHKKQEFASLFGKRYQKLNIVATHNLIYNASLMVDEGFGYALTFDKIINTENTNLKFIPFKPAVTADMHLIWKKNQIFSKASEKFLNCILEEL
ncbi:MAG: LysR family transcriptional regulator [Eubacterium sp.]|nr:LysR family transcriptional regulator [Eubacterium sp.]